MRLRNLLFSLFVMLNLGDLILSCWLFTVHSSHTRESNPIANWFLQQWGFGGFILYKILIVVVVLAILSIAIRTRPRLTYATLSGGCAILFAVVFYSFSMAQDLQAKTPEIQHQERLDRDLSYRIAQTRKRSDLLQKTACAILRSEQTFQEALAQFQKDTEVGHPQWHQHLIQTHRHATVEQATAFCLALNTLNRIPQDPSQDRAVITEIQNELRSMCSTGSKAWKSFYRNYWQPRTMALQWQ